MRACTHRVAPVRSISARAAVPRFRILRWWWEAWFFTAHGADAAADGRAADLLCEVAEAVADAAEAGSSSAEAGVGADKLGTGAATASGFLSLTLGRRIQFHGDTLPVACYHGRVKGEVR